MTKIKAIIFEAAQKGVWIPPLSNSYNRLQEFRETALNNQGSIEYKAWQSFSNSLTSAQPLGVIPDPTQKFISEVSKKPQYSKGKEEFSRFHLAGNELLKKVSVKKNVISPKKIEIHISNQLAYGEDLTQGSQATAIDPKCLHEMIAQQKSADLFMLMLAELKGNNSATAEKSICIAWDILQPVLSDTIYSAKKIAGIDRPTDTGAIKYDDVLLEVPTHSSWPGGHAFGAGALATLIRFVCPNSQKFTLANGATRIALNREYAGLHWNEDSQSGFNFGVFVMQCILEHIANSTPTPDLMQFFRYTYQA